MKAYGIEYKSYIEMCKQMNLSKYLQKIRENKRKRNCTVEKAIEDVLASDDYMNNFNYMKELSSDISDNIKYIVCNAVNIDEELLNSLKSTYDNIDTIIYQYNISKVSTGGKTIYLMSKNRTSKQENNENKTSRLLKSLSHDINNLDKLIKFVKLIEEAKGMNIREFESIIKNTKETEADRIIQECVNSYLLRRDRNKIVDPKNYNLELYESNSEAVRRFKDNGIYELVRVYIEELYNDSVNKLNTSSMIETKCKREILRAKSENTDRDCNKVINDIILYLNSLNEKDLRTAYFKIKENIKSLEKNTRKTVLYTTINEVSTALVTYLENNIGEQRVLETLSATTIRDEIKTIAYRNIEIATKNCSDKAELVEAIKTLIDKDIVIIDSNIPRNVIHNGVINIYKKEIKRLTASRNKSIKSNEKLYDELTSIIDANIFKAIDLSDDSCNNIQNIINKHRITLYNIVKIINKDAGKSSNHFINLYNKSRRKVIWEVIGVYAEKAYGRQCVVYHSMKLNGIWSVLLIIKRNYS